MKAFARARVPGITAQQWSRAIHLFQSGSVVLEPPQLRSATGMTAEAAYALILGLYEEGHAKLFLLVYHQCVLHPVAERKYSDGFQPLPWTCPECDETVSDGTELRYELRAMLRSPIEFV